MASVNPPRAKATRSTHRPIAGLILSLVVTGGMGVVGCGAEPAEPIDVVSDTDRARAAVLSSEAILADSIAPPMVHPGRVRTAKLGWDRTEVRARLFLHLAPTEGAGPKPAAVEVHVADAVSKLRAGGWTVHWALCVPSPEAAAQGSGSPSASAGFLSTDRWYWFSSAYKIADGVSYWSMVTAELTDGGDAWIDIVLRAPQASDPANLFPDRPKDLAAGATCAEDRKDATAVEQAGSAAIIREWWAFPAHERSPDPQRR